MIRLKRFGSRVWLWALVTLPFWSLPLVLVFAHEYVGAVVGLELGWYLTLVSHELWCKKPQVTVIELVQHHPRFHPAAERVRIHWTNGPIADYIKADYIKEDRAR
jgi:hypothetical protein